MYSAASVGTGNFMSIAVREEVEAVLSSFTNRLRAVLDGAMEDWAKLPNKAWLIWPRDKANIISSYIARRAQAECTGDSDVHVISEPQTVKFLFHDTVLVRFKKGNAHGVGSNIVTQSVLDFVDPQLSFAGLPDVHRVEIVYQFDILGTGFAEIAVVARDRRTRVWAYPLNVSASAKVIPLPPRTAPVLTPPAVTPKSPAEEEPESDSPSE